MFFPRTEPLALSETSLWGLRVSLNTPVVSIEELPVGPARAAIASHEEADGRPSVSIGIRSTTGGAAVLYSFEGDLREQTSVSVVIDAALSFAESMGFLFDEDEVAPDVPATAARALGLWEDLMSNAGAVPVADEAPERAVEELLLEEAPGPGDADAVELVEAADPPSATSQEAEAPAPDTPKPPLGYVPQFEGDLGVDTPPILEGGLDAASFDSQSNYIGGDEVPIGELDIGSGPIGAQDAPGDASEPPSESELPDAEPIIELGQELELAPDDAVQPDAGDDRAEAESAECDHERSGDEARDIAEPELREPQVAEPQVAEPRVAEPAEPDEAEIGDWELDLPQDGDGSDGLAPGAALEEAARALAALEASGDEALEELEAASPDQPEPEFPEAEPEAASAGPAPPRAPRLTKFRTPEDPEPEPVPAAPPRPAALGRVKLIRRSVDGEAGDRPEPALRLFGAF